MNLDSFISHPFKWQEITKDLSVSQLLDEAKRAMNEELNILLSSSFNVCGTPWNNIGWYNEVTMKMSSFLKATITNMRYLQFSVRGVVLKVETSKIVFLLKSFPTPLFEPTVPELEYKISRCMKPLYVDMGAAFFVA